MVPGAEDLHHGGPGGQGPDQAVTGAEDAELTQGLAVLDHPPVSLIEGGVGEHLAEHPDPGPDLQPERGDTVGGVPVRAREIELKTS